MKRAQRKKFRPLERWIELEIEFKDEYSHVPQEDWLDLHWSGLESYEILETVPNTDTIQQEFLTYVFWLLEHKFKATCVSTYYPEENRILRIVFSVSSRKYSIAPLPILWSRAEQMIEIVAQRGCVSKVKVNYAGEEADSLPPPPWLLDIVNSNEYPYSKVELKK